MKGFIEFIREQGVVNLAIAFVLGVAVTKVVTSLVEDIINPIIGGLIGSTAGLATVSLTIGSVQIMWGHFLGVLIDFVIVAAVIYYGFKLLRLDKLDKKK